jgi:hypothetical protein
VRGRDREKKNGRHRNEELSLAATANKEQRSQKVEKNVSMPSDPSGTYWEEVYLLPY